MAWAYSRTLTITGNSALLPATQTDFTVLVYISHSTLKDAAHSGHIQNSGNSASGPTVTMPYDLIFTSDSAGTTKIPWEVESYDGTNGVLWAWVKIASCALSTVFYCFYGDLAVNSAQNTGSFTPANAWDANFKLVCHEAVVAPPVDSTGTNTGTNHSTTTGTGQIDGGASFASGSSQYQDFGTGLSYAALTVSAWVKATTFPNAYNAVASKYDDLSGSYQILVTSAGKLAMYTVPASGFANYDGTGATLSTGTWYRITLVYSSSVGLIGYLNATQDGTAAAAGALGTSNTAEFDVAKDRAFARYWNGVIDEVRVSNTARSANWIKAEYNSQNDPATFVAVGAEVSMGGFFRPGSLSGLGSGGPFFHNPLN